MTRGASRGWAWAVGWLIGPGVGALAGACATAPRTPPVAAHKAGTPAWEAVVRDLLLTDADADRSRHVEAAEVPAIACARWQAIDGALEREQGTTLDARYGFEPGFMFRGAALGIAPAAREAVRARLIACVRAGGEGDPAGTGALVRAIADLSDPTHARWDRLAAELLRGAYDRDESGALDRGDELTRVPCSVWVAFDEAALSARNLPFMALYGFAEGYTYVGDAIGVSPPMRVVAAELMGACGLAAD